MTGELTAHVLTRGRQTKFTPERIQQINWLLSFVALIVRVATAHAPAHSNPMARVGESSARPKNFDVRVARKSH